MEEIKIALADKRKQAGLTKVELARKAGVSRQYLIRIENGLSMPSLIVLHRLASALECDMGELVRISE
ncbi:MAG TPA: helix-turn-helix transcriptional regulator [Eubacteriales bacterium]|nr:helix-turn-helix transcriptional regulator [Clostridia bacterium]HRR90501.1 helix-turn-helix transcriptional regulator [Eubacteriales bacterium]HRU84635.1 helix-turn-helix transcriptional regulator [Eubacteriales bacterium]